MTASITGTEPSDSPGPTPSLVQRVAIRPAENWLIRVGRFVIFVAQSLWYLPATLRVYGKQTLRVLHNLAWGRGVLVRGGVVSTMLLLGFAIGAVMAIETYAGLDTVGFGALTGAVGGLASVREMAPIAAGIAFAAQAGCRMTAEVGAMRSSEELDALEALGIRSIPFVVGTRLVGGMLCVIPAFLVTLLLSFIISRVLVTAVRGQSVGTYNHYFIQFIDPRDIVFATIKVLIFTAAVTIIHCYYGFFSDDGPSGVGIASGRAVRASLVVIILLDMLITVVLWGLVPSYAFRG
ncbi:ABC-transporter integral membrane protein [Mycobacteroides abscessus subsp. massiliense]|uniref:MlaE family ABC transporter permease n=1 Tax=Mycobacteroides abscessus TaxID=36809 RepID=UPI0009A8DAD5|nr:ABC transporter permease [Mycobacteroides abscessus]SKG96670.1 ABC-transporter integral membrane protein [Mycobacteroides abscessus subsp. massiliense]SKH56106.1 ABC-transporter integral membrane protein [Mycobacteroides abscessus subsp. massiliense]SKI08389.1 ABC-transporter integral membrane protein [Mycobacteroides abscessus subsp. massiliense]SKJ39245.1 ABC-transporter integral membrane protein [Mycobacteroides abscessus subsp. massiliense]SKJ83265.1 ABC-transporter integral membrane pr